MHDYLSFAKQLALEAGTIMREYFGKDPAVQTKRDGTPVTAVDTTINQMVIDAVASTYPAHGLIGEEASLGNGTETYQWICDPLDGTVAYILGIPNSMFMLALMKDNTLLLSVVYDPYNDKLFYALKGEGAFCNARSIHVSRRPFAGGYILIGSRIPPGFLPAAEAAGAVVEAVSVTSYKCMMVATGKAEGFLYSGSGIHDVAPPALIVQEAGGKVTDFKGRPLVFFKDWDVTGVIFSNAVAHQAMVRVVQSAIK
jgi:fructose-1,6-bisphosphatase/inositol monophosphatase family enzyme